MPVMPRFAAGLPAVGTGDEVAARGAGGAQPRARGALPPAAPQVGPHAALVGQRDEEVVVQPAGLATVMHLGIHAADRTREHQRLIGQVAAEVQQGATAGRAARDRA